MPGEQYGCARGRGQGSWVEAKAPEGHFITAFRVGYCDDTHPGITFLQGILDDGSVMAPVGKLLFARKFYRVSAKGCITTISGR